MPNPDAAERALEIGERIHGFYGERHYAACVRAFAPPGNAACSCDGVELRRERALADALAKALRTEMEYNAETGRWHFGDCNASGYDSPCMCSQQSDALAAYDAGRASPGP